MRYWVTFAHACTYRTLPCPHVPGVGCHPAVQPCCWNNLSVLHTVYLIASVAQSEMAYLCCAEVTGTCCNPGVPARSSKNAIVPLSYCVRTPFAITVPRQATAFLAAYPEPGSQLRQHHQLPHQNHGESPGRPPYRLVLAPSSHRPPARSASHAWRSCMTLRLCSPLACLADLHCSLVSHCLRQPATCPLRASSVRGCTGSWSVQPAFHRRAGWLVSRVYRP